MSSNAPITFNFTGLPPGYCFTSFDRFALDIVAGMSGFLPGEYSTIIVSESEPAANDRDKLWYQLLGGGEPGGRLYKYYLGKWVAPNPVAAGSQERRIFTGSESEIWSYDGGDGTDPSSNAPTATTGAMWQKDADFDFRFPIGAGTSPAPESTVINPGGTGGEEKHTLANEEIPDLQPTAYVGGSDGTFAGRRAALQTVDDGHDGVPAEHLQRVGGSSGPFYIQLNTGDGDGDAVPMNNMPPYRGVYFIRRTSRIFYTA